MPSDGSCPFVFGVGDRNGCVCCSDHGQLREDNSVRESSLKCYFACLIASDPVSALLYCEEMDDAGISSFWGPVTSTIELCEENYAYSSYIAEFYNTISNIPCILLALIGLINALRQGFEKRFSVLHISNMILAIGSMIFHATLQNVLQQSDETPMVWEMLLYLYVIYSPDWHYRSTMPTFLFIYGAVFAVVHFFARFGIVFKIHYIILCLLCVPRMY
ncbi:hypothetical protein ZIOFF_059753 [Zingiber officinale]|uniref:Alkaline ceramidase n=1 Tax=Zingiber officinale TaxID=94328 RepID=A0A8J5FBP3_ZINOF|nr:hypothetical protein ZIOFF_059753 [Zingiber officinale]